MKRQQPRNVWKFKYFSRNNEYLLSFLIELTLTQHSFLLVLTFSRLRRSRAPGPLGAFHLVKNSENSGSGLNGKRFFGSPDWKIPRKSGTAQRVVPFSRLERPNGNLCSIYRISRLYTSSMPFAVFLSGLASLGSCFQMAADPSQVSGSFLQTNFRATASALPATF